MPMDHPAFTVVDNSLIYCWNPTSIVSDYNSYIISLLERFIKNTGSRSKAININFVMWGREFNEDFNNKNPTIRIECNYEHTLVLPGGRDMGDAVPGKIYDECGKRMDYMVRLVNRASLAKADLVIDYSFQNVANIQLSGDFKDIDNKITWIYPSLYEEHELCKQTAMRVTDCLTTFFDINQPRRKKLVDEFKNLWTKEINYHNVHNCFSKRDLQELYLKTKVLVNIHQTDHHHTLEELRVLPALQCGVLVICEKCPINANRHFNVVYDDYIIWAEYGDIVQKTVEVLDNYEKYFHDIFLTPKPVNLYELDAQNNQKIESVLSKFTHTHGVH
jgi:hypothetical protein